MTHQQEITTHVHENDIQAFQRQLQGDLIRPGDAQYDQARAVWNGMIDKRPALIARCANTADVVAAVNFVRKHNVLLAVRGGGHNVAGSAVCDDGLVIDLSPMKAVQVDPQARTARAQGGATIADLDAATQAHGLAVPMGVVSETGIAELTLGGGIGHLMRKHGLSCNNLVAAPLATLRAGGGARRVLAAPVGYAVWLSAHDP